MGHIINRSLGKREEGRRRRGREGGRGRVGEGPECPEETPEHEVKTLARDKKYLIEVPI